MPQSVADAVRIGFRFPVEPEPSIDAAFQGLRYLTSLLSIARKHSMLEAPPTSWLAAAIDDTPSDTASLFEEISKPQPGAILIAHPCLPSWFSRTVVLICNHGATGSYGLCLNKPWGGSVIDLIVQGRKAGATGLGLEFLRSGTMVQPQALYSKPPGGEPKSKFSEFFRVEGAQPVGSEHSTTPSAAVIGIFESPEDDVAEDTPAFNELLDFPSDMSESGDDLASALEDIERRERLIEALCLLNGGDPGIPGVSGFGNEGREIIMLAGDDEAVDFLAAAAEALGEEWDSHDGDLPDGFPELSDQALEAVQTLEGTQKEVLMALLQSLGPNVHVTADFEDGPILPFLPPPNEEESSTNSTTVADSNFDESSSNSITNLLGAPTRGDGPPPGHAALVVSPTGAVTMTSTPLSSSSSSSSANDSASSSGPSATSGTAGAAPGAGTGIFGGTETGTGTGTGTLLDPSTGSILDTMLSEASPKQLMAMSPRSQVFLGGPVPGVNILHVVPHLGGKLVFKIYPADASTMPSTGSDDTSSTNTGTSTSITTDISSTINTSTTSHIGGSAEGLGTDLDSSTSSSIDSHDGEYPSPSGRPMPDDTSNGLRFGADATLSQAAEALGGDNPLASQDQLRFYLGSSQWAPDQVRDEIHMGSWAMVKLRNPEILDGTAIMRLLAPDAPPEGTKVNPAEAQASMWRKVLRMVSPAHAALAAVPPSAWEDLQNLEI